MGGRDDNISEAIMADTINLARQKYLLSIGNKRCGPFDQIGKGGKRADEGRNEREKRSE